MNRRSAVPQATADALLVANRRACCICHERKQVVIHHIDENPSNHAPDNLAVLCLDCHGRVTGNEGLGRRYTEAEVKGHKRAWEEVSARSRFEDGKQDAGEPVPALGALVETAGHGENLSPIEIEILRKTPGDGMIFRMSLNVGEYLWFGGPTLPPDMNKYDPALAAHYLDGLESLQRRGLVRYEEGELYMLTGRGFDARRKLLQEASGS
jgi:hypothetical protein